MLWLSTSPCKKTYLRYGLFVGLCLSALYSCDWTWVELSEPVLQSWNIQIFSRDLTIRNCVLCRLIWINCNVHHASVFLFSDLKGLINLAESRQTAWFKKITQNSKPQNVILILRKAAILRPVTFQIIRFFDVTLLINLLFSNHLMSAGNRRTSIKSPTPTHTHTQTS